MEIIYETSFWAFFFVTLLAGGGAAFAIGRAAAKGWKPFWQAAIYTMMLGVAIRFLHFGLFAGATLASWRAAQGNMHSPALLRDGHADPAAVCCARIPAPAPGADATAIWLAHRKGALWLAAPGGRLPRKP